MAIRRCEALLPQAVATAVSATMGTGVVLLAHSVGNNDEKLSAVESVEIYILWKTVILVDRCVRTSKPCCAPSLVVRRGGKHRGIL